MSCKNVEVNAFTSYSVDFIDKLCSDVICLSGGASGCRVPCLADGSIGL